MRSQKEVCCLLKFERKKLGKGEQGSEMEHLTVNSVCAPHCSKPCTNVHSFNFSQPCKVCTDDTGGKQAVCLLLPTPFKWGALWPGWR